MNNLYSCPLKVWYGFHSNQPSLTRGAISDRVLAATVTMKLKRKPRKKWRLSLSSSAAGIGR